MTTDPVRVSFVGAGGICRQRHLPGLARIPGVRLAAVCNRSAESSARARAEWGFEGIETDWRRVVDDPSIDAVFIGTWPYLHREISIAALEAGKHVFCQARMCMNWPEAVEMVQAADAHPRQVHMVCPSPFRVRWEPTVKLALASPEFGALVSVQVRSLSGVNRDLGQVSWREQKSLSGLNILQVGIFAETLHAWCGEYGELTARTRIEIPEKRVAGEVVAIDVPQVTIIAGTLAGGEHCTEHHSGVATDEECSEIVVVGSEGRLKVDLLAQQVLLIPHLPSGEMGTEAKLLDKEGQPWQVEAEFIAAIRAARRGESWRVSPDFREGARYMRKMQAIHDSALKGDFVSLADYPLAGPPPSAGGESR
ncbi:MAG: Gfo/Idh/MocA family oxidoreductase [Pirellulaceae bacterium]|nr:Gfo/Idh/MocA family oxidoreductase [Pirellulaceae bacterium]